MNISNVIIKREQLAMLTSSIVSRMHWLIIEFRLLDVIITLNILETRSRKRYDVCTRSKHNFYYRKIFKFRVIYCWEATKSNGTFSPQQNQQLQICCCWYIDDEWVKTVGCFFFCRWITVVSVYRIRMNRWARRIFFVYSFRRCQYPIFYFLLFRHFLLDFHM